MTGDDDWMSLIIEVIASVTYKNDSLTPPQSDQRLPPPDELINRMLTTHDVCEAHSKYSDIS